jgi:putative Holliday junction resolvase
VRHLGLDIGETRVGVAVSDPSGRVATPLAVLDGSTLERDPAPLRDLLDEYEIVRVVVGLPLSLDGTEGPQAVEVRRIVSALDDALGCEVVFWDERLSTSQVAPVTGGSKARAKGARDMAAATVVLQAFLDAGVRRGGSDA